MIASLIAYIQHTDEQYSLPSLASREPTHWINAIFFGICSSEGLSTFPNVGPVALKKRSKSNAVITLGYWPYPYSFKILGLNNVSNVEGNSEYKNKVFMILLGIGL